MKNRIYFITGTGTGVGKTLVASGLALAMRGAGVDAGVMKPVESGCREEGGGLVPLDALFLKEASGSGDPIDLINPYRFAAPVAPNVAAREAGVEIGMGRIERAFGELSSRHEVLIVEGAGGLLSPVTDDLTGAGLAALMGASVIVVAPNRLGVINAVLLTVEAVRSRGLGASGVVLNGTEAPDESRESNRAEIERFSKVPVLAEIPLIPSLADAPADISPQKKAALLAEGGPMDIFRKLTEAL